MAEVRLTPLAEADLERIWRYTRTQWGVHQAERYVDILESVFADLAEAPEAAPACDHIRPGYRCRRVESHMIFFRVTEYGIAVIRILHQHADAPRHLL